MKTWKKYCCALFTILFFFIPLKSPRLLAQDEWTVLAESHEKRVRVPKFDMGDEWRTNVGYDDSGWTLVSGAPGGVGYENGTGYEDLISLDVGFDMHESGGNPNTSCYIRIKFDLTADDINKIGTLKLRIRYDDGFAVFLNGVRVADANAPNNLSWNSAALGNHEAAGQDEFNISPYIRNLYMGTNLLTVQALNVSLTSSDFLFNVEMVGQSTPFAEFEESNLPLVFINTDGKPIPNEPKIMARMGIIYHGVGQTHRLDEPFNDYDGVVGIELRGSSSRSWKKKQYGFETREENGENKNISLMGLPAENDWILNAPYIDKSFLRNVLSYDLARRMGHYASRTRYCELFLNGEYMGIYILMEKIKRDKNRVNIARLDSADIEGDDLTGGYIIKIDKWGNDGFESKYLPLNGTNRKILYQYHYPADDVILPVQKAYIKNHILAFEDMMFSDDFADPETGYPAWIDVDSFVDFFIINELNKNVDGYRLSTFIHKDKDSKDGRLKMGPIWDFNLAFGLANYYDGEDTDGWMLDEQSFGQDIRDRNDPWQIPFWWARLFQEPAFNHRIKQRWVALRGNVLDVNRIHAFIDAVADTLDEAKDRNFAIWTGPGEPGEGFWPVPGIFYTFRTYQDEIDYLKSWISDRIAWMDENIMLLSDVESGSAQARPKSFELLPNYPNPFNPTTTIRFELATSAHVRLEVLNVRGVRVRLLSDGQFNAGAHAVQWDGRDEWGALAASGVYTVLATVQQLSGRSLAAKKIALIR